MNSLTLKFACGFSGKASGTSANANLKTSLGRTARCSISGANKQVYDAYQTVIAVSGTLQLDLNTGLTNPLNESIAGALDFATVQGVFIEHDVASLSTSGIRCFNGGTTEFQGPWNAASDCTLLPGKWIAFGGPASVAGWTSTAGANRIDIVNLDAVALHTATVNILILGTV